MSPPSSMTARRIRAHPRGVFANRIALRFVALADAEMAGGAQQVDQAAEVAGGDSIPQLQPVPDSPATTSSRGGSAASTPPSFLTY